MSRVFPRPLGFYLLVGLPVVLAPVAVAVGVLRYRLLGIETVLRRGLVYGTLTVLVFGVYLAVTATGSDHRCPASAWACRPSPTPSMPPDTTGNLAAAVLLDRIRAEVTTAVAEVRRIIDNLRPAALDQLSLIDAIRRHGAALSGSVTVEVTASDIKSP
jgi:hypothetical protein